MQWSEHHTLGSTGLEAQHVSKHLTLVCVLRPDQEDGWVCGWMGIISAEVDLFLRVILEEELGRCCTIEI